MSAAFDAESAKKANDIQKAKYPDMSEEMARRAGLRKTFGSGANKNNYKDLSAEMRRRAKIRWAKKDERKEI